MSTPRFSTLDMCPTELDNYILRHRRLCGLYLILPVECYHMANRSNRAKIQCLQDQQVSDFTLKHVSVYELMTTSPDDTKQIRARKGTRHGLKVTFTQTFTYVPHSDKYHIYSTNQRLHDGHVDIAKTFTIVHPWLRTLRMA